jgi:hypothetical protein
MIPIHAGMYVREVSRISGREFHVRQETEELHQARRPGRKDRYMAVLGEALITLGQWLKPENVIQTANPAYQGKK